MFLDGITSRDSTDVEANHDSSDSAKRIGAEKKNLCPFDFFVKIENYI
jgi:hypothetical protein